MVYQPLSSMSIDKKKPVTTPNENDVLCGRGSGPYSHEGNKQFREIVTEHKSMYNVVDNGLKTFIAKEVVRFVRTQNPAGRFLSKSNDDGKWYEVPDDVAVQKTKQALREKEKWSKCDGHADTDTIYHCLDSPTKCTSRKRRRQNNNHDLSTIPTSTTQKMDVSNTIPNSSARSPQVETIQDMGDSFDQLKSKSTNPTVESRKDKIVCTKKYGDRKAHDIDELEMLIIDIFERELSESVDSSYPMSKEKAFDEDDCESIHSMDSSMIEEVVISHFKEEDKELEIPNTMVNRKRHLVAPSA